MPPTWRIGGCGQPRLAPRPGPCHQRIVTTATGDSVAAAEAGTFASDWQALRADDDIQFAPVAIPERPPTPDWLKAVSDFLEWLLSPLGDLLGAIGGFFGVSGPVVMWTLVALAVLLVALLVWRHVVPLVGRSGQAVAAEPDWLPDTGEALALLEDADRLAAEGRYDEATHLLLKRSVGHIAAARPDLLEPSSTAREIAELAALSEAARGAFSLIAGRVERSLFALRSLSADDWTAARAAYAEFALVARRNALA